MLEVVDEEPLREGQLLTRRYRLQRIIGEGGMGIVWAAQDLELKKAVALKFLRNDAADKPRYVHRLAREARVMAQLSHPNIAKVYGAFETEGGTPFLVLDLLRGEPLSVRLGRGALSFQHAAYILTQVTDAVDTAHRAGIVHRDLKPENIFVEEHDCVRVLDFGIAKVTNLPADELSLTATGAMLGTPYYMAPEQIFGDDDIDYRADIWALGVLLYECLAGVRPTQASGVGQVIKIIMNDAIVPIEQRVAVGPNVASTVRAMLTRDRAIRPTLDQVRIMLRSLRDSYGAPPELPAPGESIATLDSVELGGDAPRTHQARPQSNHPVRFYATMAMGAVATVGALFWQSEAAGTREPHVRDRASTMRTLANRPIEIAATQPDSVTSIAQKPRGNTAASPVPRVMVEQAPPKSTMEPSASPSVAPAPALNTVDPATPTRPPRERR
jgi:eukaryotic-like serine/threonine-protein kinase